VGAVQGFCNMLWKLLGGPERRGSTDPSGGDLRPFVATTFRNEIYDQYKAHRPEPPEDLVPQFALIREATKAYDLPCIEMDGL
jgi:DNA polymerase-1